MVGVDQEAEFGVDLFLGHAERLKHFLLELIVGDADRTAGQLNAVQNQVVAFGPYRAGVAVQARDAFIQRHGERMVHRYPVPGFLILFEEGEFGDPKVVIALWDDVQLFGNGQPELPQHRKDHAVFIGCNQDDVAPFTAQLFKQGVQFFFG